MKVVQATGQCTECAKNFSVQVYQDVSESAWTLFSDGYCHFPYNAPPWHFLKLCPHCKKSVKVGSTESLPLLDDEALPSGDVWAPRDRVRAALDSDGLTSDERRELMLMDMWISNHICGDGVDDYSRRVMRDLLDLEYDLDPVIRADIQRQLGRFEAAREGLQHVQRNSKNVDTKRKAHIKSIRAYIGRGVRDSFAVITEGKFAPPMGRLAIHRRVVIRT